MTPFGFPVMLSSADVLTLPGHLLTQIPGSGVSDEDEFQLGHFETITRHRRNESRTTT